MPEEKDLLTPEEVEEIRDEFLECLELSSPSVRYYRKRFIIVIGGAPGSGKTTAADKLATMAGTFHVQSNSARELLREHHIEKWGKNVHRIIRAVVEDVVAREFSVMLNGMMLEEEERHIIQELADKHKAIVSFSVMVCDPKLAEQRARKRYADNKPSSFEDWRCSPEKFEEYIASIYTQTEKVDELLSRIPANSNERIWQIPNDATEGDMVGWLQPIWQDIAKGL